jgi:hypothetical protein
MDPLRKQMRNTNTREPDAQLPKAKASTTNVALHAMKRRRKPVATAPSISNSTARLGRTRGLHSGQHA